MDDVDAKERLLAYLISCADHLIPGEPFYILLGRDPHAQCALATLINCHMGVANSLEDPRVEVAQITVAQHTLAAMKLFFNSITPPADTKLN